MPIAAKGPAGAEVIELDDGAAAGLSSPTTVRLRANVGTGSAEISAFGGAYAAVGGGISSVATGNTLWVDAVNGNDGTAQSGRQDLPYLTVAAAIAAAVSGDIVEVRPGDYTESGLTVPSGVLLRGSGWTVTRIGDVAAVADILTMGADSAIEGITAVVPTAAFAGILHNAGTGSVVAINIEGDGVAGNGIGIRKTGTGKLIGGNVRCEQGGLDSYLLVDSGVLALDDVHMPQSAGAVASMCSIQGGLYQGQGFNVGNTNCADAILMGGGVARIYSPNIFNVTNAVHFTADGVSLTLIGGRIGSVALSVLLDPLLTGTGSVVRVMGTVIEPLFSFPPAAAGNTDFALLFNQEATNLRETRQRLIGGDLALGFPELGSAFSAGRGEPYSDNIKVVTSDSTATAVSVGGNLIDVTAEAASRSGSTFTFQGTAANHCIYVASIRLDAASNPLKYWGHVFNQTVAGVGGSYVCEIWDGAAWRSIGVMAHSVDELYRYANAVFLRAGSSDTIQFGIDNTTTWATLSIDGVTSYWARWRIDTAVAAAPVFERVRLEESSLRINKVGERIGSGLSRWRGTLISAGNIWSEDGTVANAAPAIGSGGGNTGWNHDIDNALFSSAADILYVQFTLPRGIDTSCPIKCYFLYSPDAAGAAGDDFAISVQPIEVAGTLVADPAGGVAPIARTLANTRAFDSYAAQAFVQTINFTDPNKAQRVEFGPYDISDFYEDDVVALRVKVDASPGGAPDSVLWGVIVEGVFWSDGKGLL